MSIGGIVTVYLDENGGGRLDLKPAKRGEPTGQSVLHFDNAPEEVTALNGRLIWGGANMVMCGDRLIGMRSGYTRIDFVDSDTFKAAIAASNLTS